MKGLASAFALAWVVSLSCGVAQASQLSLFASCLDDIVNGAPGTWVRAVQILTSDEEVLEDALDTLLPRVEPLGGAEKRILAKKLRPFIDREDVARLLGKWVRSDDPDLGSIAIESLRKCTQDFCVSIAVELLASGTHERMGALGFLSDLYQLAHPELDPYSGSPRQWYAQQLSAGVRDDRFVTSLLLHLDDPDPVFRPALVRSLRDVIDERIIDVFARLAGDPDPKLRSSALVGLAKRGDSRVYERLLALAPVPSASGSRYDRNLYFSDLGYLYWWDLENLVRRYRAAENEQQRAEHTRILWAASEQLRDGFPEFEPLIESLANDADPAIAEIMRDLRARRFAAATAPPSGGDPTLEMTRAGVETWVFVAMTCVAGVLGVVLFSLSFRLLKLRFLLFRLPLSRIRSVSHGMVALRGRVVPTEGEFVEYPSTGERCVYYPGVEKNRPGFGFSLEDETGRIRIEVDGAVLLSEKRLLLPDDDVHVIGTLTTRQTTKPDGQVVNERVVAKPTVRRSAVQTLMHFIINRVLAANARSGHSRMLFSDPRSCLWIWDDPQQKPLHSGWDLAATFAVIALFGAWLAVFALCGLATLDQEYARMLAEL